MTERTVDQARDEAVARIRLEARKGCQLLVRAGLPDSKENRARARELCGLPVDEGSGYIYLPGTKVGLDASGGLTLPDIVTPWHAAEVMEHVRSLVAILERGLVPYIDTVIAQYDAVV